MWNIYTSWSRFSCDTNNFNGQHPNTLSFVYVHVLRIHYRRYIFCNFYTPATKLGGLYWIHPVCPSVCLSVCPLTFRVRPVTSTVQDGLFPYLVQIINSMRGCVACDDPWPWPISSRSFSLCLENGVRPLCSVYSSRWIILIFGTNDHYHWRVYRVLCFFQNL